MRLNEVVYSDAVPIDGYGAGFFRVGGEVKEGGEVRESGDWTARIWGPPSRHADAATLFARRTW